jgi:hypothetical protein
MANEIVFKILSIVSGILLIGLSVLRFFKLPEIQFTQFIFSIYYM